MKKKTNDAELLLEAFAEMGSGNFVQGTGTDAIIDGAFDLSNVLTKFRGHKFRAYMEQNDPANIDDRSYDIGFRDGESDIEASFDFALSEYADLPFEWDGPHDLAMKLKALLAEKDARIAELEKLTQS
jgi:hypothetical protein